jgi:hypothetical protein
MHKLAQSIKYFSALALAAFVSSAAWGFESPREWEAGPLGHTLHASFRSAPFPHSSRAEGFTGRDGRHWPAELHYTDNTVTLFVPASYQPQATVDFVVYFHGHGNNVRKSLDQFRLREQLVASGRNTVLLFPQGPVDASDSGLGKLQDEGGLARLIEEALVVLATSGPLQSAQPLELGQIALTGHSGAYLGIGYCLRHGGLRDQIREVYLLDASYGMLEDYQDYIAGQRGRFGSIFTAHLAANNVAIMANVAGRGLTYELRMEHEVDESISRQSTVFLYTTRLDHNGAVSWLERFLREGTTLSKAAND